MKSYATKTTGEALTPLNESGHTIRKTGCAIARAACISGISYPQAKIIANQPGIHASDKKLWSETDHVRTLLNQPGDNTANKTCCFTQWESLPDL